MFSDEFPDDDKEMANGAILSNIPHVGLAHSETRKTLLLAGVLLVGLVGVTPLGTLLFDIPLLLGVVVTGLAFGTVIILTREFLLGSLIGLLVTVTFGANIPLTPGANAYPGDLGPQLFVFDFPLALLIGIALRDRWFAASNLSMAHYAFAAFAGWTVIAALAGSPIRLDTAMYFSFFAVQGLLVFGILVESVRRYAIEVRSIVVALLATVTAHSVYGVAQFVNQRSFGLTYLGEGPDYQLADITVWLVGTFKIGSYVSGFARMELGVLIVLVGPALLIWACGRSGHHRVLAIGSLVLTMTVLRFNGSDAIRGGILVALGGFVTGVIVLRTSSQGLSGQLARVGDGVTDAIARLGVVALVVATILYPSTDSGTPPSGNTPANSGTPPSGNTPPNSGGGGSSVTGYSNSEPPIPEDAPPMASWGDELAVPFFDLSSLGGRIEQYTLGIEVFLENPLFGIGGGNFTYVPANYQLLQGHVRMHNLYLALLAETGIVGFLLFMTGVASVIGSGLKMCWTENTDRMVVLAILSGMAGFLALAMFSTVLDKVTTLYTFLILGGAIIGLGLRTPTE